MEPKRKKSTLLLLEHPKQDHAKLKARKVSLCAFLDTVKSRRRKDGSCAIRIRVTNNAVPRYYSTNQAASPDEWVKLVTGRPRDELLDRKNEVLNLLMKANDIIVGMPQFNPDQFRREYNGEKGDWHDVRWAFNRYIEILKEDDSYNYAGSMKSALKSFQKFHNKKSFTFDDVTVDWLKRYEKWMIKEGGSSGTVGVYTRNMKVLYNEVVGRKAVSRDLSPFDLDAHPRYVPPKPRKKKRAFPKSIMKTLIKYHRENRNYNLDMWLFSYYCNGANPADIFRLKFEDINEDEDGDTIVFFRHKTKGTNDDQDPIEPEIHPEMEVILDRWKNPEGTGYLFPLLKPGTSEEEQVRLINNKKSSINKGLKRLFKKLEIDMDVSWQFARHTYASRIAMTPGIPTSYLPASMGHGSPQTTEGYKTIMIEPDVRKKVRKALDFE